MQLVFHSRLNTQGAYRLVITKCTLSGKWWFESSGQMRATQMSLIQKCWENHLSLECILLIWHQAPSVCCECFGKWVESFRTAYSEAFVKWIENLPCILYDHQIVLTVLLHTVPVVTYCDCLLLLFLQISRLELRKMTLARKVNNTFLFSGMIKQYLL